MVLIVLCDITRFYAQKYHEKRLCRILVYTPWVVLALATLFSIGHGSYLWNQADAGNFGLIHAKGVTSFKIHGRDWVIYWWDVVFIVICSVLTNYIRVLVI